MTRAIDILEMLVREPDRSLTEIAAALDIPKSTSFNLLCTLVNRGMLTLDQQSGRYRLGPNTVHIGGAFLRQMDVRRVARPFMDRLVAEARESCILAIWDDRSMQVYYVDAITSPETVALTPYVGRRDPAYCTALGKVLLAALPPDQLERYLGSVTLQRFTPRTISDPEQLRAHLETVRHDGYSINIQELDNEGGGIAAPITDHSGRVVAALSLAFPVYRLTNRRLKSIAAKVVQTARAISLNMGAR